MSLLEMSLSLQWETSLSNKIFSFEQSGLKTTFHKKTFKKKEVKLQYAVKQAARTERLMQEEAG